MSQNKLHVLLDRLASAARTLTEEEIEAVVSGRARIRIRIESPRAAVQSREGERGLDSGQALQSAANRLRSMASRDEGMEYLKANFLKRPDLLRLARVLDISISSRDPRSRVEERIIDATIGFRLRSEAIQNRT